MTIMYHLFIAKSIKIEKLLIIITHLSSSPYFLVLTLRNFKGFLVKRRSITALYYIPHIQDRNGIKFHFKQTKLNF